MAYIVIPDSDLLPGKPVTPSLFRRLRDNIDAGLDLMAVNMEVLAGAGNWSPPAGVRILQVTMIGGGGSGGGSQLNTTGGGGGGGSGATIVAIVNVPAPYDGTAVYAYVAGAGGAGGVDADGGNGVATTFGIYTADNGGGGQRRIMWGGANGIAVGGILNIDGAAGDYYNIDGATWRSVCKGASSTLAPMTRQSAVPPNTSETGGNGNFPGGGGAGAVCWGNGAARAGGAGGAGTIIIEY